MPTLVADIDAKPEAVASALTAYGLSWENPGSGEISVWTAQGDRLVVPHAGAALTEFGGGSVMQLWLGENDDLAIGNVDGHIRLYFDGLSAHDVARCLAGLECQSLIYRVRTE